MTRGQGWGVAAGAILLGAASIGMGRAQTRAIPRKSARIPVEVRVDFGPAGKGVHERRIDVDRGSTPKDVVSILFPVQSGDICCNTREVASIDGVRPDPAANRWWTCRLNGSTKLSPFKTVLKPEDRVEWRYIEGSQ